MANRAYLYATNKDMSIIKDVSEHPYEIPLYYKILLGSNCVEVESKIWDYPSRIAFSANLEKGLERLVEFYSYLLTQNGIDKEAITQYKEETISFFAQHPDRKLSHFFMEPGEVYDLIITDDYTMEQEQEYTFLSIQSLAADIDTILFEKPDNFLELQSKYLWIHAIIEGGVACLAPYWTNVTYFSFNNMGVPENV